MLATERNKYAKDLKRYDALIKTPIDLGVGDLMLPANARLAFSADQAATRGQIQLDTPNHLFTVDAQPANTLKRVDWIEKDTPCNVLSMLPASTISVFVLDEWHIPRLIATRFFP